MPTTNLAATAEGTDTAWALAAGASKVAAVAAPDDEGTSSIASNAGNARQGFVMADLPSSAARVTTHTVKSRGISTLDAQTFKTYVRKSGGSYHSSANHNTTTVFQNYTAVDLVLPLTVAEVNAAEVGVDRTTGTGNVNVTTLNWDVTWFPSPGGFAWFVVEWLGPLVAVGLYEMPSLAAALARASLRRHRLLPEELTLAWRELREHRYPRSFALGA